MTRQRAGLRSPLPRRGRGSCLYAYSRASSVGLIPICSSSSPTSLTFGTRIWSLMRSSGRRGGSCPQDDAGVSKGAHQAESILLIRWKRHCMQRRHSLVGSDSVEPRAARGRRGEGRCRSCFAGSDRSRLFRGREQKSTPQKRSFVRELVEACSRENPALAGFSRCWPIGVHHCVPHGPPSLPLEETVGDVPTNPAAEVRALEIGAPEVEADEKQLPSRRPGRRRAGAGTRGSRG